MKNTMIRLIENRKSVSRYDPGVEIDDSVIIEWVRLAGRSPSAFNLQNWRFIAVKNAEQKLVLQQAAFGQPQVTEASVTFIVCGQTAAYRQLSRRLQASVEQNIIPASVAESWVTMANDSHHENPALQRDEAIRSASLAAMTLMYAVQSAGYACGPMGGFDARQVQEEFELGPDEIPVMLIAVGRERTGNWPQKARRPVEEILTVL
ncbi:MAG: nitroreductase family protein [Kiritimatiellales bacterium]